MPGATRHFRLAPLLADAAFVALTLAFCQGLLSIVLGKYLPLKVVGFTFLAEAGLATTSLLALFALLAVIPGLRLLVTHPRSRGPALFLAIPLCTGIAWIGSLFKVHELAAAVGQWILLMLLGTVVLAFACKRSAPVPEHQRGFRRRLLGYSLVLLGALAGLHAIAGSQGEAEHGRLLVGSWGAASIVLAGLFLRLRARPRGVARSGIGHLAWAAGYAAVLALAALCLYDARTDRPWKDDRAAAPSSGQRPNVVLISIDTLRADHLSCYGYSRDTSPNLDRFARQGTLFERNISAAPWTLPSHSAIFTSRYPGDLDDFQVEGQLSLAKILSAAGYQTAAFTGGRFVDERRFGDGFEFYFDDYEEDYIYGFSPIFLKTAMLARRGLRFKNLGFSALNVINHWRHDRPGRTSCFGGPDRNAAAAADFIRGVGEDRPFFLFFHTFVVHEYYLSLASMREQANEWLPAYDGWLTGGNLRYGSQIPSDTENLEYMKALYDGSIRLADRAVGTVLDALESSGLTDNTLVVITSDHGEGFRPDLGRTWHRNRLHDDLLHVPLILRLPEVLPDGKRSATQVSAVDVLPTVLELVGLSPLPNPRGTSLLRILEEDDAVSGSFRKHAFSEMAEYLPSGQGSSLRSDRFKYILSERFGQEFYDLAVDPDEALDLSADHPEATVFDRHLAEIQQGLTGGVGELSAETHEMLNAMGYLQDLEKLREKDSKGENR